MKKSAWVCAWLTLTVVPCLARAQARPEADVAELSTEDLPSRHGVVRASRTPPRTPPERAEQHTAELLDPTNDRAERVATGFLVHDDNYFAVGAAGDNRGKVKFQVSVRYELLTLGVLRGYSLSFAYSQKSFWDVFDGAGSAPFLENNYRPEGFFSFRPQHDEYANEFSLGVRHESNGLGLLPGKQTIDQLQASKSWNQVYLSARHDLSPQLAAGKFRIRFSGMLRVWAPFGVSAGELGQEPIPEGRREMKERADDALRRTLGYASLTLDLSINSSWLYKGKLDKESKGLLRVTVKQRSAEISLYAPLFSRGIFKAAIYLQLFSGKAERLMTYDHRTTCFYAGFGLL